MAHAYETLRVAIDEHVGTVTVDRPDAMNAVNVTVLEELADALTRLERDEDVGAVVLTGAGDRAFIGGGDIKEFEGSSGVWFQREFRRAMRDVERSIEENPLPVVASIQGVALGGGTEIALMCDLIYAAESATFGQPEIGLGIIPGAGGTQRLAHLIGYLEAKELVLTGRHVDAEEAAELGLVNDVFADEALDDEVRSVARDLADGPAVAQWFGKKAINHTRTGLETGLELEAALAGLAFETEEKAEGVSAFVEGRDPEFGSE